MAGGEKGGAQKQRKPTPFESFIAGGVAGGVEAAVTYPFEFAKTRVQLRADPAAAAKPGAYNPIRVVASVLRNEGVRALYTGCSVLIVGTIAKDGLRFLTFDYVRAAFKDPETGDMTAGRSLLAGMAAGIVSSTLAVTPTERLKTALIDDAARPPSTRRFKSASPLQALTSLTTHPSPSFHHHARALWAGYVSTTAKQASTTAVRLGSYDIIKKFESAHNWDPTSGAVSVGNGAVVGALTVLSTQPFDCVKTRSQSVKGEGVGEAVGGIWRDGGVKGFWRGSGMRLGRNVGAGVVLFGVYERVLGVVVARGGVGEGG